jgi:hypothetical protein
MKNVLYYLVILQVIFVNFLQATDSFFLSSYTICNKGVSAIARKKGELKDRDKSPSEWWGGECVEDTIFAGYENGYPFLALGLIIVAQNTRSKMHTIGLTSG